MKKTIKIGIVVLLMICFCALSANAAGITGAEIEENLLFDELEYPKIVAAMGGEYGLLQGYKVYTLSQDLLSGLKGDGRISDLISEEYVWDVPSSTGWVSRLSMVDGAWKVIGATTPSDANTAVSNIVDVKAVNAALTTLADAGNSGFRLQCFRAPRYATTFVLIESGDGEYLVPFGARPDFTGLENGKLYSRREVWQALELNFGTVADGNLNGGGIAAERTVHVFPIVLCGACVVIAGVIGIVLFRRRRQPVPEQG